MKKLEETKLCITEVYETKATVKICEKEEEAFCDHFIADTDK